MSIPVGRVVPLVVASAALTTALVRARQRSVSTRGAGPDRSDEIDPLAGDPGLAGVQAAAGDREPAGAVQAIGDPQPAGAAGQAGGAESAGAQDLADWTRSLIAADRATTGGGTSSASPRDLDSEGGSDREIGGSTPRRVSTIADDEAALDRAIAQSDRAGWPGAASGRARGVFTIAKEAVQAWVADGGPRLGASIAFYTIFAIAPLMLVLLAIAGAVFGEEAARGQILAQIGGLVGEDSAQSIQEMIAEADRRERQGRIGAVIGLVTALIGASAVFVEMKNGFDTIFKPQEDKDASAVTTFVRARLMSVALVLAIAFLVVVSLVLSSVATAFGQWLVSVMPFLDAIVTLLDLVISTTMLTVAFWALIRYLPEKAPKPSAIWIGALTSAVLFAIGKQLIGLYLARGAVASAYGAAGSFIVVVLWVYYSSQILLLGAEVARAIDDPAASKEKAAEGREAASAAVSG